MKQISIRIIRPSSREQENLLPARIEWLKAQGFNVLYEDLPPDPSWAYAASTAVHRAQALITALGENETSAILCARGGYGASDILPLIKWQDLRTKLRHVTPKLLVGFSDVSALHAALLTELGWPGLHAPMPATSLWLKDGQTTDVESLLEILRGRSHTGSVKLRSVGSLARGLAVTGELWGGCLSVLTNLIGTPWIKPTAMAGRIFYFEDIGEHPARIMRFLNQWHQSGCLAGVKALVIGSLTGLAPAVPDNADFVSEQIAARYGIPTFKTEAFGHVSPNTPMGFGTPCTIVPNGTSAELSWSLTLNPRSIS
jgi:muramoyltetrapeptide carboxypeptidase